MYGSTRTRSRLPARPLSGAWGFARVPSGVVFALLPVTFTDSTLNVQGRRHGGPRKCRRKKTCGDGREAVGRCETLLYWTLKTRQGESFLPLRRKSKKEIFGGVSPPFIWMLSLLLVCLLLWNSVISLILKFKYINFYLVYRYLLNFSVGEFVRVWVCECVRVWGCVMHVAYCLKTSEGMWS